MAELSAADRALLQQLYELENQHLEHIPKDLQNRELGMLLEETLDIARELSLGPAHGQWADGGYIGEKVCKVLDDVDRVQREGIIYGSGGLGLPKCETKERFLQRCKEATRRG